MSEISFRPARPDEADQLTTLAVNSKRTWGYPEDLIALWLPGFTFTPENIESRLVTVAEIDGETVAVSSLNTEGDVCGLDEFWVRDISIRRGIGRRLLLHTLSLASRLGFDSVRVVSDPNAEGFYLRFNGVRDGFCDSVPAGRKLPVVRVPTGV